LKFQKARILIRLGGLLIISALALTGCGTSSVSTNNSSGVSAPETKIDLLVSVLIDGPQIDAHTPNCIGRMVSTNYSDLFNSQGMPRPDVAVSNSLGDSLASYKSSDFNIPRARLIDFGYVVPKSKCLLNSVHFEVPKESEYQITVAQRDPVTVSQKDFIVKLFPKDSLYPAAYMTALNVYFPKSAPNGLWYPSNYNLYADGTDNIAWKWNNAIITNCYSDSCVGMQVITNPNGSGCPGGLYAELNQKDSSGAAIGITNQTVGSLLPGDKANLTFQLSSGSTSANLSTFDCHP
jgi:hypothetical protein